MASKDTQGLLLPVGPRPMSTWSAHQRRTTPSTEPGTDWYCPIGTPVRAPADGRIYGYGNSIRPATGRWVGIDLDNGMRFRAMHLSRLVRTGGRVRRGEIIGYSGASGYGKEDWSGDRATGGAHVHGTLWPSHVTRFGYDHRGRPYTIDFMQHADLSAPTGGATTTPSSTPAEPEEEEEDMYIANVKNGNFYLVIGTKAHVLGKNSGARESGIPIINYGDDWAVKQLQTVVSGIGNH